VHLIHDDVAEVCQRCAPHVEHVAQDFGGHDDDRRAGVDGVVAGEQAYVLGPMPGDEIVELLVRTMLDRRRVEALLTGREREVHGKLAHDRLAGSGRSAYRTA